MKYCTHCGKELIDEAVVCTNCGCSVVATQAPANNDNSAMITCIKVFMILGCVLSSIYGFLIPLCWTLPMTLALFRMLKNKESISVGFKVCTLIFCSVVAGILLLCLNTEQNNASDATRMQD